MLDDVSEEEGRITVFPGKPQPGAPPVAPAVAAPPAVATGEPKDLPDLYRRVIAQNIYVSPPSAGSPGANAIESIALQCQSTFADAVNALSTIGREAGMTAKSQPAADQRPPAKVLEVTLSAPAAPLPPAFKCLAGAPTSQSRLELLAAGGDFGPVDIITVPNASIGALESALNATYGMPNNPWRQPTAIELLSLMPAFYAESLWGPNGAEFWTGTTLGTGEKVVVRAQTTDQNFEAFIETRDSAAKARPVWVRSGTP